MRTASFSSANSRASFLTASSMRTRTSTRSGTFPKGSAHRRNLQHAPEQCGLREFRELSEWITPRRHVDALFLSFPVHGDLAAISRFAAAEARRDPGCRAEMLVTPDMDPEHVREEVRRHGFAGLKCYHIYSARPRPTIPTWRNS